MAFQQIVDYSNIANFTPSPALSVVDDGTKSLLGFEDLTGFLFSQNFASDIGFSYNSSKAEFVAGAVQSKDQTPLNSLIGATFTSSLNASWRKDGGSETATLIGTPSISGNKAVCTGTNGFTYARTTSAIETHKFIHTPQWTGVPAQTENILSSDNGIDTKDRFTLAMQSGTGGIRFGLYDNTGTLMYTSGSTLFGTYSPVSGTPEEIELVIDSTNGVIRLFIDGVKQGELTPGAWTRGGIASRTIFGAFVTTFNHANSHYEDYISFSNAQHAVDYVSGYTIPENIYSESKIDLPQFSYSGLGAVQDFVSFAATIGGVPRFILNSKYYNAGWVASSDTYATASSLADVIANIATLPASDTLDISVVFPDSNIQASLVDDLIAGYTGQRYIISVVPFSIVNSGIDTDGITDFEVSNLVEVGSDRIKFVLSLNGTDYWYNTTTSAIEVSTGYAQSNSWDEIAANASEFTATLLPYKTVKLKQYFYSDDGTTTPSIEEATLSYSCFTLPTSQTKCCVSGYIKDNGTAVEGGTVTIKTTVVYGADNNSTSVNEEATSRSNGYYELEIVQGATVTAKMLWTDSKGKRQSKQGTFTVPVLDKIDLEDYI